MENAIKKQFTILLVDDREANLLSLEEILANDNRVFIKARSGEEALKIVLKAPQIGLILLDVQMPGMDGFEVAEVLKSNAKTKDISIIFVTAINKDRQYVMKGFQHGAVDYLQKPLDVSFTQAKVDVFEQLYYYQQELHDSIEQKNKINTQLERFMYVVAHDLKSPLTGVVGLLELMKRDPRITEVEDLKYYMSLMIDASNHLCGMINSILDYSRKNNMDQTEEFVDVNELVQQIGHLLFPPQNITISVEGNLPRFKTRKFKLQQIFQNLISNAIKYNDKQEGKIAVGCIDDGEYYKFYIKDNGPGINEKDKERIFRLFETTDNKSNSDGSTGVGLNITKLLVEEQGGKITVDSIPSVETSFYFQWMK